MQNITNIPRKEEIYDFIYQQTEKKLKIDNYENLGCNATDLGIELKLDRANISRILNNLCSEGYLIKIQGRPTLYVSRESFSKRFPDMFIPVIIPKGTNLKMLFSEGNINSASSNVFDFSEYIGSQPNESLHKCISQAESSILYPVNRLNILINGEKSTGKEEFAKFIYNFSKFNNIITNENEVIVLDCYMLKSDDIISKLNDTSADISNKKMIILLNIDNLISEVHKQFIYFLQGFMSKDSFFSIKKKSPFLLSTINNKVDDKIYTQLKGIFPVYISLPELDQRTVKEKIEFILTFFQDEASSIDNTICISKNILNCFAASRYPGNLNNLQNEIRYTISNAYGKKANRNSVINIDFEDISDDVLNNLNDISNLISELDGIHSVFDTDTIYFIPNSELKELSILKKSFINSDHLLINPAIVNQSTDIYDICKSDMGKTVTLQIDTIHSLFIKSVYDCVYPILKHTSIINDEKVLYGLLLHLSQVTNEIRINSYHPKYQNDKKHEISEKTNIIIKNITNAVKVKFNVVLPEIEQIYIGLYIELSGQYINSSNLSVLITCYGDNIAESYAKYVNTLNYDNKAYFLEYSSFYQNTQFNVFSDKLMEKAKEINQGKGIVLVSDIEPLTNLDQTIFNCTGIPCITVSPISLPLLLKVMDKANMTDSKITDFKNIEEENVPEYYDIQQENIPQNNIVNILEEKILPQALIFLNPKKASELLFSVLLSILKDLHLNYSDEIAVKFIIHSSFVLERTIKNETLSYKKLHSFINEYNDQMTIIEKNFVIVNNTFGINIPPSEFAMITEIFLNYMAE